MIAVNSIRIASLAGNLRIDTTHTPNNAIVVERADLPDLVKALVAVLGPDFIYEHGQVNVVSGPNEDIARYVQGDGLDPQLVALADGIRCERYARGEGDG